MRAVVIGAGFAGLAAADELLRGGVDVQMFEARDRVGGRVWSARLGEDTIERGAEFILPDNSAVIATAERFGLRLVRKGLLYGDREPVGGEQVSGATVRSAIERLNAMPRLDRETVDDLLARACLKPGVAEAIRSRIEVSCAFPVRELDARVVHEGAAVFGDFDTHSVEGGNATLAAALARAVGEHRIHLSTPVRRVRLVGTQVEVVAAGATEVVADAAVVTAPASALDAISFDPSLPQTKTSAHQAVRYGQAAKLFIGLKSPVPPSATLSVPGRFWCYTQLTADGRSAPFVAAFAGTGKALAELDVARGPRRWMSALATLRPDLELDVDRLVLATWSDDPWVKGAYSALSANSPLDEAELARPVGPIAFAGEHTAGARHGTMEGALRSGVRGARDMLAQLA